MDECENIQCVNGFIECDDCNGTGIDMDEERCKNDDCFDGLVECKCNPNNIRNK